MHKLLLEDSTERIFPKILRTQAQQAGDALFLVSDRQRITFAEADRISDALAAGLRELGLGKGDRIVLLMGNCPEMVLLALAANKLAAIWTPISTDYKGQWLLDALQRSQAKILVTDQDHLAHITALGEQLTIAERVLLTRDEGAVVPAGMHDYAWLADHSPLRLNYDEQHYGDTCAILWTSGTTGKSKGVLQSYNGWIRAIVGGSSIQYASREGDIIYCVLPLFNTAAWITCIFRALIEGLPCVIEEKFSVAGFWDRIAHFGATQTFALGAMGVFLLNAPARPDDADTPLRVAQIVPIPPDQWRPFEERFGLRLVRSGMGQSECQVVFTQLEDRPDVPVYAMGFPLADTDIRLCDEQGEEVAPGQSGEICIKPLQPYVLFNGYFDNPEATEAAYHGAWYRTGDLARQDPATGAYFYVDRTRDAVRFAGRNISTLEVESIVRRHPAVQDVAAFGMTSSELDSEQELKLALIVKPEQDLSPEAMCQFINDNGPHYFVPRYIDFVEQLPYTPTNKVQKYLLREQGNGPDTWDLRRSTYQVQR